MLTTLFLGFAVPWISNDDLGVTLHHDVQLQGNLNLNCYRALYTGKNTLRFYLRICPGPFY